MNRLERAARGQRGFTLVELLVAATLMGVILTASLTALVGVERGQRDVSSRTDELAQAATGAEQMSREIRQASAVITPAAAGFTGTVTTSSLTISTRVYDAATDTASTRTVTYVCAQGVCSRSAGGVSKPLIRNVTADNAFTVSKSAAGKANYVRFDLRVQARGRTITLADGVQLRNV